jgi:sugar/nucleoside kinase (ribokinase family)
MARGQTLESALKTGCLAASEVIGHIGARPQLDLEDLTKQHGLVG